MQPCAVTGALLLDGTYCYPESALPTITGYKIPFFPHLALKHSFFFPTVPVDIPNTPNLKSLWEKGRLTVFPLPGAVPLWLLSQCQLQCPQRNVVTQVLGGSLQPGLG